MYVITADDVTDAYSQGVSLLGNHGYKTDSRAGEVLKLAVPVTTVFMHPLQRVLLAPGRVGNPVFHAMSAIWMLAGYNNARWLDQFVHDFSERFAEPDGLLHGAYGFRWRHHFDLEGGGGEPDQLKKAIDILRKDRTSRQVVLQMWDPVADLGVDKKDRPCNLCVCFNYRQRVLDMTVYNRSNDIIWGLYGENHVQFSMLHEYVSVMSGLPMGIYYHVSNDYHAYTDILDTLPLTDPPRDFEINPYTTNQVSVTPLISDPSSFDDDCQEFILHQYDGTYNNYFFNHVLVPMAAKDWDAIDASDWKLAVKRWKERKMS